MREALAFLTPVGGARAPSGKAFSWFPAAGLVIGGVLGLVWWGAGRIWPPGVAAAVVVAADLALTGMLHVDGLVDSADGLLPHLPVERRLEVMAAPDVGAFGIAVAGAVLLLRWSSFAALAPSVALMAGLWCLSRAAMAVIALILPYARRHEGGLATAFIGGSGPIRPAAIGGGAVAVAIVLCGVWPAVAAVAAAVLVALFGYRRIGGFTGDVLGAAGVVAETVGLLVAAAR
jgi:adenosylcobinamide-GDP ribazoletransferase